MKIYLLWQNDSVIGVYREEKNASSAAERIRDIYGGQWETIRPSRRWWRVEGGVHRLEVEEREIGGDRFDFREHLQRQREWSERTFGPGDRAAGVIDHIRKELTEIEENPTDLEEWIDVVILALDGAWRSGASPDEIIAHLVAKHAKNEKRTWPDWRTAEPGKAIEHVKE